MGRTASPRTRNAWSDRLACLPSGGSRPSSTSGPLWISISTSLSPTTTTPTRSGSHCGSLRSSAMARRGPRSAAPGPGGRCVSAMRSWTSHTIAPARTLRLGTHRSGSPTSGASTSSQRMPECGCDCTSGRRARPECSDTRRSWTSTCASSGTSSASTPASLHHSLASRPDGQRIRIILSGTSLRVISCPTCSTSPLTKLWRNFHARSASTPAASIPTPHGPMSWAGSEPTSGWLQASSTLVLSVAVSCVCLAHVISRSPSSCPFGSTVQISVLLSRRRHMRVAASSSPRMREGRFGRLFVQAPRLCSVCYFCRGWPSTGHNAPGVLVTYAVVALDT
mmetsp:Transcript_40990/g.117184  ORF Transcript_40990/g.117184 Transcript_40990/m.117184 type:complete len:337 (-) Transcript_40990:502-1512(-)